MLGSRSVAFATSPTRFVCRVIATLLETIPTARSPIATRSSMGRAIFLRAHLHNRIAVHRPQGSDSVVVLSVIDNLVKGAAGQAVQNMNILFDLPEETALADIGMLP